MNCAHYFKLCKTIDKKILIQVIIDEINSRSANSKYEVLFEGLAENGKGGEIAYYIVRVKRGKVKIGVAYYNPKDRYYNHFGRALAICRACGWKDLEEGLLAIL